jgi:hypothetical protein
MHAQAGMFSHYASHSCAYVVPCCPFSLWAAPRTLYQKCEQQFLSATACCSGTHKRGTPARKGTGDAHAAGSDGTIVISR